MWRDDVNRFGLIALATDLTIEGDAQRLLPPGCRLNVTRIAFDNPTTAENLKKTGPHLKAAPFHEAACTRSDRVPARLGALSLSRPRPAS